MPEKEYSLPDLPYAYDGLEPHYDKETVELHHSKHHAGYVAGLNTALKKLKEARASGDYALIKHWSRELAFHGSGHMLHSIFWTNMSPGGGGEPTGKLADMIQADFGNFENFKAQFITATVAVEGSGWGILGHHQHDDHCHLSILQCEKHQDLTLQGIIPIMVCDVWEHAYYLKYQNRRADFVKAFFNIVNWADVSKRLGDVCH
jgi:Fe-Mn family superoxide dismutase